MITKRKSHTRFELVLKSTLDDLKQALLHYMHFLANHGNLNEDRPVLLILYAPNNLLSSLRETAESESVDPVV